MFCPNCGTQLSDGTSFCSNCGAKIGNEVPVQSQYAQNPGPYQYAPPQRSKTGLIIGICSAAAVIVLVIVLIFTLGGGGQEAPVENFLDGMIEQDADLVLSAYHKKEIGEGKELFKMSLELAFGELEDMKLTYSIKDKEKIKGDELDSITEYYDELDIKVEEAYNVKVSLSAKIEGETEKQDISLVVFNDGSDWYLSMKYSNDIF